MSRDRQDLESESQLWLVLKVWHDGQITRSSSADSHARSSSLS